MQEGRPCWLRYGPPIRRGILHQLGASRPTKHGGASWLRCMLKAKSWHVASAEDEGGLPGARTSWLRHAPAIQIGTLSRPGAIV